MLKYRNMVSVFMPRFSLFPSSVHVAPIERSLHFFRVSQKAARCLFKSADHEWNSLILCFALVLVAGARRLVPSVKQHWVWMTWNDIIVLIILAADPSGLKQCVTATLLTCTLLDAGCLFFLWLLCGSWQEIAWLENVGQTWVRYL